MKLNRQNKLLIAGFFIALYLCYAFAFSNTLEYYSSYTTGKKLADGNANNPAYLKQLALKEQLLAKTLAAFTGATDASFQNELLKQLTALGNRHGLKIIDFKEPHIFVKDDIRASSYVFSLQGSFNGILLAVNGLENDPSLGYIKNITFTKKKNYKTNIDYLTAEVILQKNESAKGKK